MVQSASLASSCDTRACCGIALTALLAVNVFLASSGLQLGQALLSLFELALDASDIKLASSISEGETANDFAAKVILSKLE